MKTESFVTLFPAFCVLKNDILNTYDTDWLSHGVTWQILAESSAYAAGATVQSGDFAPNGAYS